MNKKSRADYGLLQNLDELTLKISGLFSRKQIPFNKASCSVESLFLDCCRFQENCQTQNVLSQWWQIIPVSYKSSNSCFFYENGIIPIWRKKTASSSSLLYLLKSHSNVITIKNRKTMYTSNDLNISAQEIWCSSSYPKITHVFCQQNVFHYDYDWLVLEKRESFNPKVVK